VTQFRPWELPSTPFPIYIFVIIDPTILRYIVRTGHGIVKYVGVLISLWLFLFVAQPKEFFLDGLKKLEQRSHKCVELRGGICRVNTFFQPRSSLFSL
jgi:hypothetical protein